MRCLNICGPHHDVELASLDVGEQPLQCRAVHVTTRVGGIIVVIVERDPALGMLARDVGVTGIALGIDVVVLLVEPSSVDLRV